LKTLFSDKQIVAIRVSTGKRSNEFEHSTIKK
jgi:hypothetical protein